MFLVLTFWWITGVLVYLGCLSAISMSIFLIPDFLRPVLPSHIYATQIHWHGDCASVMAASFIPVQVLANSAIN